MQICPECGEENPAKFRLCGFCGTPLGPALPPREVRKTVTIVFSDLKGSTAMGEKLDSESLREVMTRYFDSMRTILEQHGGRVEKYIGDAIMAVFGLPRLHEDDALRAVRAAAEMRDELHRLNDRLEEVWGVRLTTRTGVNTGEVVAGDPTTGQRLVIGDPVNVAARLEQAAPAMQVLIGDSTYRLVRDAVTVEEVEPLPLKGKSEPVPAYRLVVVSGGEGVARRLDSPLVGRAEELGVLEEAYATAVAGPGCVLTAVLGDAGLGKTRITGELASRLGGEARVVRGRCLPYGQGITFWPLVEAVREVAEIRDDDDLHAARAKLSAVLDDPIAADRVASAVGLSNEQYPVEELFWGARKLVEALARERPLVLLFDDLHWAEATFLDLVEHLAETVEDVPLLLVGCSRPEVLDERPEFAGAPRARRLMLGRLSEADAEQVVEAVLVGGAVAPDVTRRVAAAAEGNALFLEQLVSMLLDEGLLHLEDGEWKATEALEELAAPPSIHALMATRLDGLTDEERTVIEAASVAGQTFPVEAVEQLVPDVLRERVSPHLRLLARKRLVEPIDAGGERFRFGHIMIRDAAYSGLLKRGRATLHEKFADWADRSESDREVEYEEIRGWHLEQAYRHLADLGPLDAHGIELGVRASQRLASAGRRAFARGDMPAAVGLFRRAASLVPELSPHRLSLLPDLGEALMDLGEFQEAERVLDEAIDAADLIGDARLLEDAKLVRLLLVRQAMEPDGWGAEVVSEAERARPVFEDAGAHAELARMWRLLSHVHGTGCRYGEAAAAAAHALEHAREAGDVRQQARAANWSSISVLYGPTHVDEAIRRCEAIAASDLEDQQAKGLAICAIAQLEALRGDIARARELYVDARSLLEDVGGRVVAASTSLDSAVVEMLGGAPAVAEADLRRDYETLERMGERYVLPSIAAMLAHALYEMGRNAEALTMSATAEKLSSDDDVDAQTLARCARAKSLARVGQFDEAEELARSAVEALRETDALVMQADALSDLAAVLGLAGRESEAAAIRAEALEHYARKGATCTARAGRA